MSREKNLEFFIYNHKEQEFNPHQGDQKRLTEIIGANPDEVGKELSVDQIDALLVLDSKGERWFLAYSDDLGIVGQRTSRRQADTIARSGYRMPEGYTIKGNYPMVEMSETNIGDLWRTVQQKYVKSDLSGMSIDPSTGIPAQLADRANVLSSAGHEDDLTEAKLEKEEGESRMRAMERTQAKLDQPGAPPVKLAPAVIEEQAEAPKPSKKATKKKATKKKKAAKKKAEKKKTAGTGSSFLEITSVKQNVVEGNTQTIARGKLTHGDGEEETKTVVFDQDEISQKQWTEFGLFLSKGDIVEITMTEKDGMLFATSLKM